MKAFLYIIITFIFIGTAYSQETVTTVSATTIINKGKIVADDTVKVIQEENKGQKGIVIVEFDYRVEDTFLLKLPKVSSVKNTHDFIYEITFSTTEDMRSHVFDFAHDNALKILQLNQKNASLESLFRELTS